LILNVDEVIAVMRFRPQPVRDLRLKLNCVNVLIFLPRAHLFYFFHLLRLEGIFDHFLTQPKSLKLALEDQYHHFQLKAIKPVQA